MISFYCKKCELDQDLREFVNANQFGEWFQAKCEKCSGRLVRYITERTKDPYFSQSRKLREERKKYKEYFIQYGEEGFAVKYPESYKKFKKMEEEGFIKKEEEVKKRDNLYKQFSKDVEKKEVLDKIYND